MPALIDLTGREFGRLRVLERLDDRVTPSGARQPVWGCQCACGRRTVEEGRALRAGRAMSCRECVRDPSRMLKYAQTYVAYWPQWGVLKVGRAWRSSRLDQLSEDAIVIVCMSGTDETWEREALQLLRARFPTAFDNATQAEDFLRAGRGWSECVLVDEHELEEALDLCMTGFARGNDLGYNPPATPGWRHTLNQLRTTRRARRRGDAGCVADGRGAGDADPAGCGDGGGSAVAGGGAVDRDGSGGAAPADARGVGADHDRDRAGRGRVDSPRRGAVFTGCKRECACERAGACVGGRARAGGRGRPAAGAAACPSVVHGCSADRVSGASAWFPVSVWCLPHRSPESRDVHAAGSRPRSARSVGVGQRSGGELAWRRALGGARGGAVR